MTRLLAPLLAVALGACAAVGPPAKESVLRVDPPVPAWPARAPGPPIALAPIVARGAAAERRYVYLDPATPGEVRQAATLFWEEPPPRLVERALTKGLAARLGAPVLPLDQAPGAARRLTLRLDRFEEAAGADARATVEMQAAVLADRTLLFAKRYCAAAPIAGPAPGQRAAAFEAALTRLTDALAADLSAAPAAVRQDGC